MSNLRYVQKNIVTGIPVSKLYHDMFQTPDTIGLYRIQDRYGNIIVSGTAFRHNMTVNVLCMT